MATANIHSVFHLASVFSALSRPRAGSGGFQVCRAVGTGQQRAAAATGCSPAVCSLVLESRRGGGRGAGPGRGWVVSYPGDLSDSPGLSVDSGLSGALPLP